MPQELILLFKSISDFPVFRMYCCFCLHVVVVVVVVVVVNILVFLGLSKCFGLCLYVVKIESKTEDVSPINLSALLPNDIWLQWSAASLSMTWL